MFVGDNIYPYTVIHLDCLGSDVAMYRASMRKLRDRITAEAAEIEAIEGVLQAALGLEEEEEEEGSSNEENEEGEEEGEGKNEVVVDGKNAGEVPSSTQAEATPPAESHYPCDLTPEEDALVQEFVIFTGARVDERLWDVHKLMEYCNKQVPDMANFFLMNEGPALRAMCPPRKKENSAALLNAKELADTGMPAEGVLSDEGAFTLPGTVLLSCGHVESSLQPDALDKILLLFDYVKMQVLEPTKKEDDYNEYTTGEFSVCMTNDLTKWAFQA
jgi:hypothetical protein